MLPGITFFLQLEIIEFFVDSTVFLIFDSSEDEGFVTEYPLGSLSADFPPKPTMFVQPVILNGGI